VASRVIFTDVAPKQVHIHRGRIADLFLDTPECNAHTTAADILWSGTPILTFPKYGHKMCSRVGASIAYATGHGNEMVVNSEEEYEERAVAYAQGCRWEYVDDQTLRHKLGLVNPMMAAPAPAAATVGQIGGSSAQAMVGVSNSALAQPFQRPPANGSNVHPQFGHQLLSHPYVNGHTVPQQFQVQNMAQPRQSVVHWLGYGPLMDLRRKLWENRDQSLLFDTLRWTRNLEKGLTEAWRRWESGQEFDEVVESRLRENLKDRRSSNGAVPHGGNIVIGQDGIGMDTYSSHRPHSSQLANVGSIPGHVTAGSVGDIVTGTGGPLGANEGCTLVGVDTISPGPSGQSISEDRRSRLQDLKTKLEVYNNSTATTLAMPGMNGHHSSTSSATVGSTNGVLSIHPLSGSKLMAQAGFFNGSSTRSGNEPGPADGGGPGVMVDPLSASQRRPSSSTSGILKAKFELLEQQIRRPDLGCIFVTD